MSYFRANIEKLEGYVPGYQPAKFDVIKLNTNENPYPPSENVMRIFREITGEQLRRYPDPMGNKFREAAAKLNGVEPDYILCCNGGDDLLRMAFQAFCDEKRSVAYPIPTYSLYPVLAGIQNCQIKEIPFDDEYNLPARLAGANATLTIVCNPNAPTGSFVSVDELASLVDEINGVLLIDEAYVDFAENNCIALAQNLDNVILLRSLSKGYSLAGLRFGYAIAKPELIDGLIKVKDSYNADAVAIAAATEAIKDQQYFAENIKKIKAERKRLTGQLRKLGFGVPESFANFVLAQSPNGNTSDIYEKLAQRNIYVRYFSLPGLKDKLRITIGRPEQDDKLIAALKEILA